jgi:hypothetical protein
MRSLLFLLASALPTLVQAQETTNPAPSVPRVTASTISSTALQDVGPWGAAALPEGMNALPSDLWRGADPATLGLALSRVSADQRFPSLQMWLRQAVFSGGIAPTTDPDITRARFEAASRLGPADAAARLIFAVPRLSADPALANIAIDAGLRAGRNDVACGLIEAVASPPQTIAWLETRATCYALNNEAAAANLSVDLARTAGQTDTWLSRAVAAASGPVTAPPPFRIDSGRALALSLRANLKPAPTLTSTPDTAGLSALARNATFLETLPPIEKLTLQEISASRGVLPAGLLPPTLIRPEVPPASTSEPIDPTSPVPPAAMIPTIPAQITSRILGASTLMGRAMESRRAIGEIKAIMSTQPGLITLSEVPVMIEAALWAGDARLASQIAALVSNDIDPKLGIVLALYNPASQPQISARLLDMTGGDQAARRVALRNVMVAGAAGVPLGEALPALVQQGLPTGPAGNSGLRIALDLAGARGAKGEVVLLTALALQSEDAINANPETLIVALRNLVRVGLPEASRDIARDYLLAQYVTLPARAAPRAPVRSQGAPAPTSRPTPRPPAVARSQTPASTAAPAQRISPAAPAAAPAPRPAPARTKPSWGTP